jgi:hypothetical protein
MPGTCTSTAYCAAPRTLSGSSIRSTSLPMRRKSSGFHVLGDLVGHADVGLAADPAQRHHAPQRAIVRQLGQLADQRSGTVVAVRAREIRAEQPDLEGVGVVHRLALLLGRTGIGPDHRFPWASLDHDRPLDHLVPFGDLEAVELV